MLQFGANQPGLPNTGIVNPVAGKANTLFKDCSDFKTHWQPLSYKIISYFLPWTLEYIDNAILLKNKLETKKRLAENAAF